MAKWEPPRAASLWVVASKGKDGWVAIACNVDPEPPPILGFRGLHGTRGLDVVLQDFVRRAWLDAGDGKGHRLWDCPYVRLEPGLNRVALVPRAGPQYGLDVPRRLLGMEGEG